MTDLDTAIQRIDSLLAESGDSLPTSAERLARMQRQIERSRWLLADLGITMPPVILVGGTSGKGSVVMQIEAVLRAHGLRVGTYTSPYLQTPLEVVRVEGRLMPPDAAIRHIDRVMESVARMPDLHYLEAWMGVALLHIVESGCDAAVIEVGMGGRYDRTNALDPAVSVITTVHYDHMRMLGSSLQEIAHHKAGILRAHRPAILGQIPDPARPVIEAEAEAVGASLVDSGNVAHPIDLTAAGARFDYHGEGLTLRDVHLSQTGAHQVANAGTALRALEAFAACHPDLLTLDADRIREGLKAVRFAGRLEMAQGRPTVILDGAHNGEKVDALLDALRDVYTYDRLIVVLGMLRTKQAIADRFARIADHLITTTVPVYGKPSFTAAELAHDDAVPIDDAGEALAHALTIASPGDLVVVTGSLYLVGMLRPVWYPTADVIAQRTMFPT